MRSENLARHLILNGIALTLASIVAFYPIVLMVVVWEVASASSHLIATLARVTYVGAVISGDRQ